MNDMETYRAGTNDSGKERIIQEFVPGKQVTLAHIIANPDADVFTKLGLPQGKSSIGIMTITPSEGSIIAADIARKAGCVKLGFVDRFSGSLVIIGDITAVESALRQINEKLHEVLGFTIADITKT